MKLLKRVSIIVIIFLKIKIKSLNNLLESTLIEFSLSLVNIFTMPSQIRNEVRRVIKTLIIEEYFFNQSNIYDESQSKQLLKKKETPKIKSFNKKRV